MCGIFGFVSHQSRNVDLFHTLAEHNTVRGNLGFGGCYQAADQMVTFRRPIPFEREAVPFAETTVALGHIRAPTGGRISADLPNAERDIHPFQTTDLLLAHNGILLNHVHFSAWTNGQPVTVDSQIIIWGIQTHLDQGNDLITAIQKTVSQLEGQQACWLWHKASRQLYFWRVMSPIYISQKPDLLQFSSNKSNKLTQRLQEGRIYQMNAVTLSLAEIATFDYQTPYRIR